MITPIKLFSGNNIDKLYKDICTSILSDGIDIDFGDAEEVKKAREVLAIVQVYGNGLRKVLKGKTPKGFRYKGSMITNLMKTFVNEGNSSAGFDYTYPQILRETGTYTKRSDHIIGDDLYDWTLDIWNQFIIAQNKLIVDKGTNIMSNRNVGSLYTPAYSRMRNMPCFNWFQVRYQGNGKASLRLLFRSHDYGDALWANASSIGYGFKKLVFDPAGVEMEEIIIISASGHVYEKESQIIEELTGITWNREKPKLVA